MLHTESEQVISKTIKLCLFFYFCRKGGLCMYDVYVHKVGVKQILTFPFVQANFRKNSGLKLSIY